MSSRAPSEPTDPDAAPLTPRNTGEIVRDTDVAQEPEVAEGSPPAATDTTAPSIELGVVSGERRSRPVRQKARVGIEDTLLSVPAPAPSFEVEVEDRLSDHERRIDELTNRVRAVEARQGGFGATSVGAQPWLVWVVFLLALALAWQIFARGR
jgi:hypothetical protein